VTLEWSQAAGRMIEVAESPAKSAAAVNLDRFKSRRGREAPAVETPETASRKPLWAKIQLADVLDRHQDVTYAAHIRLLVYLTVNSHDFRRVVRLTNRMAAEIGLTRVQKFKALRRLEVHGYVTVERCGQDVPVVTVLRRGL
jgi:hypothetical protein